MKKKSFKVYKDRFKSIIAFAFIGAYGITGSTYGFLNVNKTLFRNFEKTIFKTSSISDELIENEIDSNKLSKINILTINLENQQDLYYLRYCTNLKYIEIYNAQSLTDLMIEQLNQLDLKEINLYFDRTYALKHIQEKFDMNRFKDKSKIKTVKFCNYNNSPEVDSIIFFEYLSNYDGCDIDIFKYEKLNNRLNEIINSLDLDYDSYNNIDNLFKITKYVLSKIEYDKDVHEYNEQNKKITMFTPIYRKTVKYNKKSISEVEKKEGVVSGICTNYADEVLALSVKGNVCINTVKGEYEDIGHAWNIALFRDYMFYFDPTWFDSENELKEKLDKYLTTHSDEDFNNLIYYFVIDLNSERAQKYQIDYPLEYYCSDDYKSYRTDYIYGTNISEKEILINGLSGVLIYEALCAIIIISEIIKGKLKLKKKKQKLL